MTAPVGLVLAIAVSAIDRTPIHWPVYWETLPRIFFQGLGLVALAHLVNRQPETALPSGPSPGDMHLGGLLPHKLVGARLLAIEAQDHYVRVHTERGAALVLMAFETALTRVAQPSAPVVVGLPGPP
jgi:hypothetical protein